MSDQWSEIADAIRSSDPDQVNDAMDRIKEMDVDERSRLFDHGFGDLAAIYEASDDGYVRQSVVRAVDRLTPGIAAAVTQSKDEKVDDDATEATGQRLDTACGFLLEAIQDEDGRVRQSAKRALNDVYRGYEIREDTETVAAVAAELGELADAYDDKRRDHLLESKEDAEFLLRPTGARIMEEIRRAGSDIDDT